MNGWVANETAYFSVDITNNQKTFSLITVFLNMYNTRVVFCIPSEERVKIGSYSRTTNHRRKRSRAGDYQLIMSPKDILIST